VASVEPTARAAIAAQVEVSRMKGSLGALWEARDLTGADGACPSIRALAPVGTIAVATGVSSPARPPADAFSALQKTAQPVQFDSFQTEEQGRTPADPRMAVSVSRLSDAEQGLVGPESTA
jgi:hypothetical protein